MFGSDATDNPTMGIVKIAILIIIGIAMLSLVDTGSTVSGKNAVLADFTGNPVDGDIVVLDDYVFEFDDNGNVSNGNIMVTIGITTSNSKDNLKAVIQNSTTYEV
jgi:hypothetical protein